MSEGRVRAPDLGLGKDWFNTDRPLRLSELCGKIVLLDFWTYCCVNCLHVLPELKRLERKYSRELVVVGRELYVAMAGPHQIWFLDLGSDELGPYAGSSREGCLDGPLHECALAQPSGITSDGFFLYVADSEASAIRSIPLDPTQDVTTLAGFDLFQFGDIDGKAGKARLQHPLGIECHQGTIYVADTYNHKIKTLDPVKRRVRTLLGDGSPGSEDGKRARFYEPSGVSIAGGFLYVADTNNHAIRRAHLSKRVVSTIETAALGAPART